MGLLSNILTSSRCPGCQELQSAYSPTAFCPECAGKVVDLRENEYSCEFIFPIHSIYEYSGPVADGIRRFKFYGDLKTGLFFAAEMAKAVRLSEKLSASDIIIHLPNCKYRLLSRRYNQSRKLAKEVSRLTGIPFADKITEKKPGTKSQIACKTERERWENISGAFSVVRKDVILNKTVLVIDDVMTSGATLTEMAKTLLNAGAARVFACTAAKAPKSAYKKSFSFDPYIKPTEIIEF